MQLGARAAGGIMHSAGTFCAAPSGVRQVTNVPRRGFIELRGNRMRRLHLRHILCPIDLPSPTSGFVTTASAMARARKAELRALHVIPSQGAGAPAGPGSVERQSLMSRL